MIEILIDEKNAPPDAPIVCASTLGFSPLSDLLLNRGAARTKIMRFAEWMRDVASGAYIALIDSPPAPRPIGLIQTNQGNFYESRHTKRDVIWRDFYYATVYTVLSAIDERWTAPDVELTHPTGSQWPQDLVIVVREVIDHLNANSALRLQRVHLSCLHDLTRERVDKAALELGAKPKSEHRPVAVETAELSAVGAPDLNGALLQRIDLPDTA